MTSHLMKPRISYQDFLTLRHVARLYFISLSEAQRLMGFTACRREAEIDVLHWRAVVTTAAAITRARQRTKATN